MLCNPSSKALIASASQGKAIFFLTPRGKKMVIASGTTGECSFYADGGFDNQRHFSSLWQSVRSDRITLCSFPDYDLFVCSVTMSSSMDGCACHFWILWFLFSCLSFFNFTHMILFPCFAWLCSFFDAVLPLLFLCVCVSFSLSSACALHLICSGLLQPENIVLTLQVNSAHWTRRATLPLSRCV